jgi:hypothetical protein
MFEFEVENEKVMNGRNLERSKGGVGKETAKWVYTEPVCDFH